MIRGATETSVGGKPAIGCFRKNPSPKGGAPPSGAQKDTHGPVAVVSRWSNSMERPQTVAPCDGQK